MDIAPGGAAEQRGARQTKIEMLEAQLREATRHAGAVAFALAMACRTAEDEATLEAATVAAGPAVAELRMALQALRLAR